MSSRVIMFIVAFVVWCLLCWVPGWQDMLVGLPVALIVAFMTGGLFIERVHVVRDLPRYWYFCAHYLPMFLWECIKANLDVAYRVINPRLPINPGIVKVKTDLQSNVARTFLANSITLTPGTMSVDIDPEQGFLYVHWIDVKDTDVESATKEVVERFEKILRKVFE